MPYIYIHIASGWSADPGDLLRSGTPFLRATLYAVTGLFPGTTTGCGSQRAFQGAGVFTVGALTQLRKWTTFRSLKVGVPIFLEGNGESSEPSNLQRRFLLVFRGSHLKDHCKKNGHIFDTKRVAPSISISSFVWQDFSEPFCWLEQMHNHQLGPSEIPISNEKLKNLSKNWWISVPHYYPDKNTRKFLNSKIGIALFYCIFSSPAHIISIWTIVFIGGLKPKR